MAERSNDWMKQAGHDLSHARFSCEQGDYEWACFAAQQAAEKAVKALAIRQGGEPWGHSVTTLLENLPADCRPELAMVNRAKVLDKHYIQPRYPNGFDSGAPADYYTRDEAEAAIAHTEVIIAFCRDHMD